MPRPPFKLIARKIKESHRILVATHVSADFDAASSALALGKMLTGEGKEVYIYVSTLDNDFSGALPDGWKINHRLPKEKIDLVFGLDHAKEERLAIEPLLLRDRPFLIAIDHHPLQSQGGDISWIDSSYASTSQMLYELAKELGFSIDADTSFLLLLGIVSDTDGLSQQNATPEALRAVADLVEKGASLSRAQTLISEWGSAEEVKAFAKIVGKAKIDADLKLLATWVSKKNIKALKIESGTISNFANALRMIRGVEIALLLVEEGKEWRGHLRSRPESKIDLGKVAAQFGGGGHFHAAGFKTSFSPLKTVSKIKELLASDKGR